MIFSLFCYCLKKSNDLVDLWIINNPNLFENMKKWTIGCFILSLFILAFLFHSQEINSFEPIERQKIVFLGDSITYSGINITLNVHSNDYGEKP